jgi:hypothetical protein
LFIFRDLRLLSYLLSDRIVEIIKISEKASVIYFENAYSCFKYKNPLTAKVAKHLRQVRKGIINRIELCVLSDILPCFAVKKDFLLSAEIFQTGEGSANFKYISNALIKLTK